MRNGDRVMSEQEIQQLKQRTTQELMLQDPKPVLDALGLEYKEIGYDSYKFKVRDEKKPSAKPLLYVCKKFKIEVKDSIMIGGF